MSKRIVVIGSGFGGLAAAVRLAARGHDVTLIDKRDKPGGRAYAYEQDGFTFDGGPTVTARTDQIRTVQTAMPLRVVDGECAKGRTMLLAAGNLESFVACYGEVEPTGDGEVALDAKCRGLLGVEPGDEVLAVDR